MNRAEALLVLRKAVAYCPAMRTNDDTAAAWAEALAPYELQDGLDAVADVAATPVQPGEQLWVTVQAVIWQIRRYRSARIAEREHLLDAPPADPSAYLAWRRRANAVLAARDLDDSALLALAGAPGRPTVARRADMAAISARVGAMPREERS
ncbi:hypothetical protein [Propionibacterium acidifaciens]|uniref:hypothetical protein n=1 Tax=Propionibacterium acidifaciens TaxID=556499 RepID=UPI0028F086E7|nr:hypothetical protein [Propionibacterium acidifaciens]